MNAIQSLPNGIFNKDYVTHLSRLKTLETSSNVFVRINASKISQSGFYACGSMLVCFYCGLGLLQYSSSEDSIDNDHLLTSQNCPFILLKTSQSNMCEQSSTILNRLKVPLLVDYIFIKY